MEFPPLHQMCRHNWNMWLCVVLVLSVSIISIDADTKNHHDLYANLFANYNKLVRPVVSQKTTTTVIVGMMPLAINDLDEEKQTLEMDSWILLKWKDEFLVWDPQEYDGITSMHVPSTELWVPDITIYTGTPSKRLVIEAFPNVIANYTGDVLWAPPVTINSRCPLELDNGRQTCVIKFGSWTYHEYVLDVQLYEKELKLEHFINKNQHWELLSVTGDRRSKYYDCCKEPYPYVEYNVNLRRRSRKCNIP